MERLRRKLEVFGIRKTKTKDTATTKTSGSPRQRAPTISIASSVLESGPTLSCSPVDNSPHRSPIQSLELARTPGGSSSFPSANNSLESLQSISSQISDGSVDGTLTALLDLIDDHTKLLARRSRARDAEGRIGYDQALQAFRTAVETQRPSITGRNIRRENALVTLYHDLASEFTSLMTELGQNTGGSYFRKLQTDSAHPGQSAIYSRFGTRLQDLERRFAASMVMPSPLPTKVDLVVATASISQEKKGGINSAMLSRLLEPERRPRPSRIPPLRKGLMHSPVAA